MASIFFLMNLFFSSSFVLSTGLISAEGDF